MSTTTLNGLIRIIVLAMLLTGSIGSFARAGLLNGHAAALAPYTGTQPFNNGLGLSGTIDYAVFTAANFNANFGGLGYVPGGPLVYTYQLFITGNLGASAEIVLINNPANTIGTFDIGDVDAISSSFTPNARWLFSPEVASGMSSWGLAFSSPNLPIVGPSLTVDGGTSSLVNGVPTPGPIPEPATIVILLSCLTACCSLRRRR